MVLQKQLSLVTPYLMTGSAHEGGGDKGVDGRVVVFPSTSPNELRVTVCEPLRGVPVAELEVRKSYATGKH
jgi:hypothetical protein